MRHFRRGVCAFLSILMGLVAVGTSCSRSTATTTARFIERGNRYAKSGDYKSAAIEFRNAIKQSPSSVEAHARMADASAHLKDGATATAELMKVAELQPRDVNAQLRAGEACLMTGRVADARVAFERAVAVDPGNTNANRALAAIYTAAGDQHLAERYSKAVATATDGDPFALIDYYIAQRRFADAERELRPLVDVTERAPAARLRLAPVLYERGMRREADAMLDATLRGGKRDAAPWLMRARFRLAEHHLADAAAAYKQALEIEPLSIEALAGLTALDLQEKRHADAVERLERTLARTPDAMPVLMLAARAYAIGGAADRAERTLQHLIEVSPDSLDAYALLGDLYVRQQRLDAARTEFERIAARASDPVPAKTMVAMILDAEHRPDEAQARYEEILKTSPSAGVAANNLAWRYLEQGRVDEALHYAVIAKQSLRRLPQANDTLGWTYYRKGQYRDAIPLLADCVDAQPQNPLYRYHLAMAYMKADMGGKARDHLKAALASGSSFAHRAEAQQAMAALDAASDAR